ncbi:MAG: site-2 protease family protein [Alphaproteobacteria bacterium]|nr:MAG: site-2 protease family protein [Alphaproteobacteria bacterium]
MTSVILSVLPFLLVLTTLVFVHELGHYWVARRHGVHVETFSIGFGPELWGWTDKNQTRWRLSMFPLGGYVRMLSDEDNASNSSPEALKALTPEQLAGALHAKTPWQRIQVAAAGPLANYLFAIFLMWGLMLASGEPVSNPDPVVGRVLVGSAADQGGLRAGDRILAIDGRAVDTFIQMSEIIRSKPETKVNIQVMRNHAELILNTTPSSMDVTAAGSSTKVGVLGVEPQQIFHQHTVVSSGLRACERVVALTVASFSAISQMIFGERSTRELVGPLGIAKKVAELAHTQLTSVLWAMAFLSVSLGFINILPIPLLDGGQIVMYAAEMVNGAPFSERVQTIIGYVGLVVVGLLFFVSTSNDVVRFLG